MDFKIDMSKVVKIVIKKDDGSFIEYSIDNGTIVDATILQKEETIEEKVDKLVDGKKIENEERAETMRVLGPIIIVVGAAITVFAIVQYKGGIVLIRHPEKDTVAKLKEYKELLDSGIISQEEFDRKKAELLNL